MSQPVNMDRPFDASAADSIPSGSVAPVSRSGRIEDALLARSDQEAIAIIDRDEAYSYRALVERAFVFQRHFLHLGIRARQRVAVFLDKSMDSAAAIYGAWMAQAIVVPVYGELKVSQVEHILSDSDAALMATHTQKLARLRRSISARCLFFDNLPDLPERVRVPSRVDGGHEPAALLYTSGSSGQPKGILVSHNNLLAGARIVNAYLGIDQHDRILSVLPFSFDYGLNQLLSSVRAGATLVLQRSSVPADICRNLQTHRITGLAGVPPLWIQLMMSHSPFAAAEFPHLRYITNSGGVFPEELVARYRSHLPHTKIFLMYGLTEAFRSTYLPPEQIDERPGSMGRAIPECRVEAINESGSICAPGEVGELVHAGPTVSLGYWNRPEDTAKKFRPSPPGFGSDETVVFSGDLVRRDDEGYFYFMGRRDAMIKSYGFRMSPDEIEQLLLRSPNIAEVVVHGEPNPVAGQTVVAHLVPVQPRDFSVDAFNAWCRLELPRHMAPAKVVVHDSFPRTASGKVDRPTVARTVSDSGRDDSTAAESAPC
jgi:acyl-CoA synthetase (AMP-forming)/AMP-acid ligase II